jgi:2-O-(6-phospho-alpha-D-mannosyl)-D-glycerate hydrolase
MTDGGVTASGSADRAVIHLVPHTHWDREWYEPFQVFRMRLVELIDQLLDRMVADPRLRFTLDGQAATVDDYLEIRPEAEPLIRQLIAEGRLAIGPWQILLDEFLVSGETIIRNLEVGWTRAEGLGGSMRVGYLPDMFGHIAQMPQILQRAGIEQAVVWRGVPASIDRHTFLWRSPDGSVVETEYLVGGYGNGAYLFDVPDRLGPKLGEYRRLNASIYGDRSLLAMYGTDHAVPSPRLADLVDLVNAGESDVEVRLSTLSEYLDRDRVRHPGPAGEAPTWEGELRSGARANMLMNVVSARVDLKAAAARAERRVERYAEPLAALHGDAWPGRLLELAWRRLIENSAHDSICGCSHDEVVAQVIGRYAEADQIASGIVAGTMRRIASTTPARSLAIVNPSPFDRHDVVELDCPVPAGWGSVAVRTGDRVLPTQELVREGAVPAEKEVRGADLDEFFRRRRHGRELLGRFINGVAIDRHGARPTVVVRVDRVPEPPELDVDELMAEIAEAGRDRPDDLWQITVTVTDRRRVLALLPAPALGYARATEIEGGVVAPEDVPHAVEGSPGSLRNGLVEVTVDDDGTFRMTSGGVTLDGVGRIVDGGDAGDSYNYGPPGDDRIVDTPLSVDIRLGAVGPLRGELTIVRGFEWPRGLTADATGRSERAVTTEVTTVLELRADEPFVRVSVAFDNDSSDHRVRWHIPLPAPVTASSAEGQFAIVERGLVLEGGHGEVPLPTFPALGFVSVDGCSVLLDQVTEYELVDGRELALTLLRSFGLISRNANPYREDPAGPEVPVPAAQLLGARSFRFALMPHSGTWDRAGTREAAERYRHPFLVVRGTGASDAPADQVAGLRLEGDGVVLSAVRRRDDWLEVRVVNERPEPGRALLRLPILAAREVDLLGRTGAELRLGDGGVTLDLGPWEIRTVQVRRASPLDSPQTASAEAAVMGLQR